MPAHLGNRRHVLSPLVPSLSAGIQRKGVQRKALLLYAWSCFFFVASGRARAVLLSPALEPWRLPTTRRAAGESSGFRPCLLVGWDGSPSRGSVHRQTSRFVLRIAEDVSGWAGRGRGCSRYDSPRAADSSEHYPQGVPLRKRANFRSPTGWGRDGARLLTPETAPYQASFSDRPMISFMISVVPP